MKQEKKAKKEALIIRAAENVFEKVGYKNAKMENIAIKANITKVTLYSYFQSKENLYLAVTYTGFQKWIDIYYKTIKKFQNESGLRSTIALMESTMNFFQENSLYSEALLEFFSIIRNTDQGKNKNKLTDAFLESIYFNKMQDVQNLPFKLTFKEIERGKEDGSITINEDSMLLALQGWTMTTGYAKVMGASGKSGKLLFNIDLKELKKINLNLAEYLLTKG